MCMKRWIWCFMNFGRWINFIWRNSLLGMWDVGTRNPQESVWLSWSSREFGVLAGTWRAEVVGVKGMFCQRDDREMSFCQRADSSNVLGTYIIWFHIVQSCICGLKLAGIISVALGPSFCFSITHDPVHVKVSQGWGRVSLSSARSSHAPFVCSTSGMCFAGTQIKVTKVKQRVCK